MLSQRRTINSCVLLVLTANIAPMPCAIAEGAQPVEDSFVYNGNLAVDCLPYDTTEPAMHEVRGGGRA